MRPAKPVRHERRVGHGAPAPLAEDGWASLPRCVLCWAYQEVVVAEGSCCWYHAWWNRRRTKPATRTGAIMFFYLLLLVACGPTTDDDSLDRTYIEQGYRAEDGEAEPWIRSARVWCKDGWWDMHVSVSGIASSAEWIMDVEGEGEPHRMVADGWVPDDRLQDFTNESPYSERKERAVETHIPCEVGLTHMIWIQGSGARPVDYAFFGPNAAEFAEDCDDDMQCTVLSYDDDWYLN